MLIVMDTNRTQNKEDKVMLQRGQHPYLECSSRGEKRLSAFYARPSCLNGASIEEAYQAMKVFEDGTTGLTWQQAKGRRAVNARACASAYIVWWVDYIQENPDLLDLICKASGLSDMFGKEGNVCQADVLWDIRNAQIGEN